MPQIHSLFYECFVFQLFFSFISIELDVVLLLYAIILCPAAYIQSCFSDFWYCMPFQHVNEMFLLHFMLLHLLGYCVRNTNGSVIRLILLGETVWALV